MLSLRAIVLAAGGLMVAACCEPYGYDTEDVLSVQASDPVHAAAVADCFAEDFRCERLCVDLLGPPPAQTIRSITECYVDRAEGATLVVHARSHLVQKCVDDEWGWDPEPTPEYDAGLPDAFEVTDAGVGDAAITTDAAPPDAGP